MAMDSIHERIRQGLKTVIEGLGLVGIEEVYLRALPDEDNAKFPCVMITLEEGMEEEGESTTEELNWTAPCNILVCDRRDSNDHERAATWLGWRGAIATHLRDLIAIPSVPEVTDVSVKALKIIDPEMKAASYKFMVSGLVAVCSVWVTRPRA